MTRQGFMALVVGLAVGWAGAASAGPTAAQTCEARKTEAAGEKAECLAKEQAKAVEGKTPHATKCSEEFAKAFAEAEAIAGPGVCPTQRDAAAMEAQIDAAVAGIAKALTGVTPPATHQLPATGQKTSYMAGDDGAIRAGATLSFTDNHDGTITDNNTGLQWEKQSNADGSIHDGGNTYTWTDAFAVHVAGLNAMIFAGHNDWRLPNVKELQSIVNYQNANPAVSPAFHSGTGCVVGCTVLTCSCTSASAYWSSSTDASSPAGPWYVDFGVGVVKFVRKSFTFRVRAVRGGL